MKIAVSGSTGHLGRLVIAALNENNSKNELFALARSTDKAKDLKASVRKADYDEPQTLAPALAGIDTLLLISATEFGQRARQHRNVIDAAKKAGVKRIVYTSLLHADTSSLSLAGEHLETEAMLKESGIPHTILRNGWYTENYADAIGAAVASGMFVGSADDGKISSAARADYAEAAAIVAGDDAHAGKTYELAGDESYTMHELAAEASRQSGKSFSYQDLPQEDYAAILIKSGLPTEMAQIFAGWDISTAEGALFDDGRQLSRLIGRPTTPMATSVAQILAHPSAS